MVHQITTERSGQGRREVRAALWVVIAVVLVSAVGGGVWGMLAPTERVIVNSPGVGTALTGEGAHRFDAVAIFVCVGAVTGLLTAAAAWRLRRLRGPVLQLGLLIGSLAGAGLMVWCGEHVARRLHPHAPNPPLHTIVEVAPTVDAGALFTYDGTAYVHAGTALIVQPLVASLVILVRSALSTREDLGSGLGRHRSDPGAGWGPFAPGAGYGPYGSPDANGTGFMQVPFEHSWPVAGADSESAR
jgi:hypothetical protein